MFSRLLTLFLLLSSYAYAHERDFQFGKVDADERSMKFYDKDSTASALVLREFGTARILYDNGIRLTFEYHVRIKVFNDKASDVGNVVIPLRKSDNNTFETVRDIEGVTYYLDQDGLTRQSILDEKQIFKENKTRFRDEVKFALPNVKAGSILEYKYIIDSPFIYNFRTWSFQSEMPKVYSEYIPIIPAAYNYNVVLRGPLQIKDGGKASLVREGFQAGGFKCDCSELIYRMENIPAFKTEDKMTAASNFISAVYFELSEYYDAHSVKHKVTKDWPAVDAEMRTDESFGGQLKKGDIFKESLAPVLAGTEDPLKKARLIFNFFQKYYKWNDYYGAFTDLGVRKAFNSHNGNVADINLSLVAALNSSGLDAEPVLLSTREHGVVNKLFPIISEFNYVVAKVNIGDSYYLLDATDPLLPFGLLPLRCINDKGRVMNGKKSSYWIDLIASQPERTNVNFMLELNQEGKLYGTIIKIFSGYAAYNQRKAMTKYNSEEEYLQSVANAMTNIKVLKSSVQNRDSIGTFLREIYQVEFKNSGDSNLERIRFNPFLSGRLNENPFRLAERSYPVDLGAPTELRMVVSLRLPADYELETKPADLSLALPNKGGKFQVITSHQDDALAFSQTLEFSRSVYGPEEYPYIKELYNKMIASQKNDIVLKRKSAPPVAVILNRK